MAEGFETTIMGHKCWIDASRFQYPLNESMKEWLEKSFQRQVPVMMARFQAKHFCSKCPKNADEETQRKHEEAEFWAKIDRGKSLRA